MFPSILKKALVATTFGAVLGTGIVLAAETDATESAAEAAAAPAEPGHKRHRHRGPIDLAQAAERAAYIFEQTDKNADGAITEEELGATKGARWMHGKHRRHAPMSLGADAAEAQTDRHAETFAALDADGNGQLTAEEFARVDAVRKEQRQRRAFKHMDANGDGSLSKDEFPPFTAHLKALDTDNDGQVTREEMRAARFARPAPEAAEPSATTETPANG